MSVVSVGLLGLDSLTPAPSVATVPVVIMG
jgi:hypothetical protein